MDVCCAIFVGEFHSQHIFVLEIPTVTPVEADSSSQVTRLDCQWPFFGTSNVLGASNRKKKNEWRSTAESLAITVSYIPCSSFFCCLIIFASCLLDLVCFKDHTPRQRAPQVPRLEVWVVAQEHPNQWIVTRWWLWFQKFFHTGVIDEDLHMTLRLFVTFGSNSGSMNGGFVWGDSSHRRFQVSVNCVID